MSASTLAVASALLGAAVAIQGPWMLLLAVPLIYLCINAVEASARRNR